MFPLLDCLMVESVVYDRKAQTFPVSCVHVLCPNTFPLKRFDLDEYYCPSNFSQAKKLPRKKIIFILSIHKQLLAFTSNYWDTLIGMLMIGILLFIIQTNGRINLSPASTRKASA
jgi:hypothetical protein